MNKDSVYTPIESKRYPGYFLIPDTQYTNYAVNSTGVIVNLETGNTILGCPDKRGYLVTSFKLNVKTKVHRLVCLAFHGPHPHDKPQVNHGDGITCNNYYKNLEWVTQQENVQHAYDTGLNPNVVPIMAWDTRTDPKRLNIQEYPSIAKAVDAIPSSYNTGIGEAMRRKGGKTLYLSRYLFKLADDTTPWPELDEIYKSSGRKVMSAYNVNTKEIRVGESQDDFS